MVFLQAFLFIFLAEMADKTQLVVISLTRKYRYSDILVGIVFGIISICGISILLGNIIGNLIPLFWIRLSSALAFLYFGFSALIPDNVKKNQANKFSNPIFSIAITFFLAEVGDKTQLSTLALAANNSDLFSVMLGCCLGLIAANILGLLLGKIILNLLPDWFISCFSCTVFLGFAYHVLSRELFFTPILSLLFFLGLIIIATTLYLNQRST